MPPLRYLIVIAFIAMVIPADSQATLDSLVREIEQLKGAREKEMSEGFQILFTRLSTASVDVMEARGLLKECGYNLPENNEQSRSKTVRRAGLNAAQKKELDQETTAGAMFDLSLTKHCSLVQAAILESTAPEAEKAKARQTWLMGMLEEFPLYRGQEISKIKAAESPIVNHFGIGYKLQGTEIGKESLNSIPALFRRLVLEPARTPLKPEVVPAWDTLIKLRQAVGGESAEFTLVEYPELLFQRDQDRFKLKPDEAIVAEQVQLVKTYREHPKFADMTKTILDNVEQLRKGTKAGP